MRLIVFLLLVSQVLKNFQFNIELIITLSPSLPLAQPNPLLIQQRGLSLLLLVGVIVSEVVIPREEARID